MESSESGKIASTRSGSSRAFVIALVVLFTMAFVVYLSFGRPSDQGNPEWALATLGLGSSQAGRLAERFKDSNHDLVADPPVDSAEWIDPARITFSYIATDEPERYEIAFREFIGFLASRVDRPVEYRQFTTRTDQLQALKSGGLHITGLNTGSVPWAVNQAGFVPIGVPSPHDRIHGYRMVLLASAASPIHQLQDIRGRTLTLTEPSSNSGYKGPLVLLMSDFGMMPGRDYDFNFSYSHDRSLLGLVSGRYELIATASDLVDRYIGSGELDPASFRKVYESEVFPPAVIGYRHDLAPHLASTIRQAVFEFAWSGTGLEKEFGPAGLTRYVPISFKDDFSLVRRIDDSVRSDWRSAESLAVTQP